MGHDRPVPLGSRARRALSVLVLASLVLAGCGDDDSGKGSDYDAGPEQRAFEDDLEAMAGVADAKVEREAFDTDYYGEEIVVDMVSDATAEQVTGVLDALRQRERDSEGAPQDSKVTLGAGTTSRSGDDFAPDAAPGIFGSTRDHEANEQMAQVLVTAAAALPGRNVVVVEPASWSVHGSTEEVDPRPAVDEIVDAIRADEALSAGRQVSVTVDAADDRHASLNALTGFTTRLTTTWDEAATAFEREPVQSVWLAGSTILLTTRLGDDVRPRDLTTQAYGDALWPLIHDQLDLLADLGRRAELEVTNEYAFTETGNLEDRFVDVTSGRPARRDRYGRTWNAEATAYLDQVLATR